MTTTKRTLLMLLAAALLLVAAGDLQVRTATIAAGQSLSGAVYIGDGGLVQIQMPAAWTAADLTFQASLDGTNYANLYDEFGTEVQLTVAASRVIRLDPSDFAGSKWIKLRSGTSGVPVVQVAARAMQIGVREWR